MAELDTELENASVALRQAAGSLEARANRIDLLHRVLANELRQEAAQLRSQADLALAGVVRARQRRQEAESAAEQMCSNYALQADAIRELLDQHAPQTTGNLQTRLAQVFAIGDDEWVTETIRLAIDWSRAYDKWDREGTYRAKSYEHGKQLGDAASAARQKLVEHLRRIPRMASTAAVPA